MEQSAGLTGSSGKSGESPPYRRLRELGIVLPSPPKPVANFVTAVRDGGFLFLSGQGPLEANGVEHHGKVGAGVTVEEAYGTPASPASTCWR